MEKFYDRLNWILWFVCLNLLRGVATWLLWKAAVFFWGHGTSWGGETAAGMVLVAIGVWFIAVVRWLDGKP